MFRRSMYDQLGALINWKAPALLKRLSGALGVDFLYLVVEEEEEAGTLLSHVSELCERKGLFFRLCDGV